MFGLFHELLLSFRYENNDLKASGTGIYQEVFDNIDYGDETPEEAVNGLLDGMESVGYTIA